jgi:hypothetical protein
VSVCGMSTLQASITARPCSRLLPAKAATLQVSACLDLHGHDAWFHWTASNPSTSGVAIGCKLREAACSSTVSQSFGPLGFAASRKGAPARQTRIRIQSANVEAKRIALSCGTHSHNGRDDGLNVVTPVLLVPFSKAIFPPCCVHSNQRCCPIFSSCSRNLAKREVR